MAKKPLRVSRDGETDAEFELREVKRESLYGSRQRAWLDETGKPCSWGQITPDGLLIRSGMMGTHTEPGPDVALVPSSHDVPPEILMNTVMDMLNLAVEKVYELTVISMSKGMRRLLELGWPCRTTYNLSACAEPSDAFVIANEHGVFLLAGRMVEPAWILPTDLPVMDDDDSELDDDDFESLI